MPTKREKTALIIAAFVAILFLFIPQRTLNEWEWAYLIFFVLPMGVYVLTDPERKNIKGE